MNSVSTTSRLRCHLMGHLSSLKLRIAMRKTGVTASWYTDGDRDHDQKEFYHSITKLPGDIGAALLELQYVAQPSFVCTTSRLLFLAYTGTHLACGCCYLVECLVPFQQDDFPTHASGLFCSHCYAAIKREYIKMVNESS